MEKEPIDIFNSICFHYPPLKGGINAISSFSLIVTFAFRSIYSSFTAIARLFFIELSLESHRSINF